MTFVQPNRTGKATKNDEIMTKPETAKWIVDYFNPSGKILDPCRGEGAFYNAMDEKQREWCEIKENKDFFDYEKFVNWIITNPPYSIFDNFLLHSFKVANNVVLFCPLQKVFKSKKLDQEIYKYGGVREVVNMGSGGQHGFPFGFVVGAIHYQRGYRGDIKYTRAYK